MDVTNIAHLATNLAASATKEAIGVAVMKKAHEVQASTASAMLAALPPATRSNQPEHLGRNIDTTA